MSRLTEAVVRDLVAAFPSLQSRLDAHIHDYDGVLAHVLMADFQRYVVAVFEGDEEGSTTDVQGILDFLEQRFRQCEEPVRELISVSFLELLPREGERGAGVRGLLGREMAAEADRVS